MSDAIDAARAALRALGWKFEDPSGAWRDRSVTEATIEALAGRLARATGEDVDVAQWALNLHQLRVAGLSITISGGYARIGKDTTGGIALREPVDRDEED
jgi:hypothetical protein